jgi:arabinose-5-phosphate isomerase
MQKLFNKQRDHLNYFFDKINIAKTQLVINFIASCNGTVIVSGVGKSGLIAKKLSMTLLSTGTKSFFLSPSDALHGDIGMVDEGDVFLCFSKSGETKELIDVIPFIRNKKAKVVAVVSDDTSQLVSMADNFITLPMQQEICPYNLVPTTSTALQLIFGDILAITLMEKKKFTLKDFAANHPSGLIGKKITIRVEDVMLQGEDIPICFAEDRIIDVLHCLSSKQCGSVLVVKENKDLIGIFTDGDLRRSIENYGDKFLYKRIRDVMTTQYKFINKEALAWDAIKLMEKDNKLVSVLPVIESCKVVGIIRMHDILQTGLK